jgi:hypothetical protein
VRLKNFTLWKNILPSAKRRKVVLNLFNGEISRVCREDLVSANQIAGKRTFVMYGSLLEDTSITYLFKIAVRLQAQEGKIFRIPDFLIFKESRKS